MRILSTVVTVIMMFSIVSCGSMMSSSLTEDFRFETESDPKANFSGYKSYMWIGSSAIMNDPYGQWEPTGFDADAEIKFLINRELRSKGMTEAARQPDVLIGYAAGINMTNIEYKENKEKKFKTLEAAPKGTLAILMVDADTGIIIWAGTARADVQGNKDSDTKKRLDYAVKTMLNKIPR